MIYSSKNKIAQLSINYVKIELRINGICLLKKKNSCEGLIDGNL